MKKKLLSILSLSLIFTIIFAMCASAATPRWSYVRAITPTINKNSDTYYTTVGCVSDVIKVEVDLELYQKGLLGSYSKKSSCSKTINATGGTVSGTYDMDSSKTYRLDVTVTATTSSGATETVTVSHEA